MNSFFSIQKSLLLPFTLALCVSGSPSFAQDRRNEAPDRPPRGNKPPREERGPRDDSKKYSLEQAVSDNAQLHTISFSGLAFVTGDFGASTFIPPGKVCDFFGFQYMRDIDAAQKGHNPMFLNRVCGNVLKTLTEEQRKKFADLAVEQAPQLVALAEKRFPLIYAFCREKEGAIPPQSNGLNQQAVMRYVGDIFEKDAELSYRRAQVMGEVIRSFTPEQKAYLGKMTFGNFGSWPDVDASPYKMPRGTEKMINVAYMTYGSELFSWYAGSLDADTYFCPERHGTYFGGFYMKDMPAMGKKDFDISTSVTGDSGKEFLQILDEKQRKALTSIPDQQRRNMTEIISVRRAMSTELRKFMKGETPDKKKFLELGRRYGELDGAISTLYAVAFGKIYQSLTPEQRPKLMKLRNLDGYTSAPAYIYSAPVKEAPKLPNTDAFFFPPK